MTQHMLIIDDDEVVLNSCRKIFKDEDFEVVITTSAKEGIRLASSSHFDVILSDWQMPEKDGLDVVAEVNRISPDSVVIMITGYPSVGKASEAFKRGVMDYIAKPFTPEEIIQTVQRAISRKTTEEKKAMGKFEKIVASLQFPMPNIEDKNPKTIAETVASTIGVGKVTSPWFSVMILGVLAGAYIGFGGLLATSVTFDLPDKMGIGFTKIISGATFSLGLMLVVIAGAELFTGNNLMISSVMTKEITVRKMIGRWTLVFIANFIGSIILALLFYFSGLWKTANSALGIAAINVAAKKVALPFGEALIRGIGCNWLVCLAVWMALAARQTIGKIFAIFFPIMGFVAIGFEHCIANMYFIPSAIFLIEWGNISNIPSIPVPLTWINFLWNNLIPVTIGNIIGGVVFVGMSYWSAYLRPNPNSLKK
ncbi:MAG: formate/nitrite transporter family protein [Desulfobacterales bacterium]|nr:formate/nitrite transporter family protein [Desulfobacterales bacterium]MBF0395375.1 formate/nitrite transporter family protein [Desulfobacterales bacterium]